MPEETPETEHCPFCFALVTDLYMHLLWHEVKPLGPRFRKRYLRDKAKYDSLPPAKRFRIGWN